MTTQVTDTPAEIARAHAAGARTQVVGLVLLALAPLTMFAIEVVAGFDASEFLVPLTIGTLVLIGAWCAGRFGTWSKVLGIVLTVLVVLAGFWLVFGLSAIQSPADFVPSVLFVLGVGMSLTGGIRAVRARDRPAVIGATPGEDRARLIAVTVVVLAVVVSVTVHLTGRQTVDAAAAAGATPVTMDAFEFATTEVTVAGGPDAALLVNNRDAFLHDLAVPDQDLAVTVAPGSQKLLDVADLAAGTYTFYCTLHSDTGNPDPTTAGMAGTLVVQ